jgi:hypothetical protein
MFQTCMLQVAANLTWLKRCYGFAGLGDIGEFRGKMRNAFGLPRNEVIMKR